MFLPRQRPDRRPLPFPRFADDGMTTAEYAIGTLAAAAFAAVLYTLVTGEQVGAEISDILRKALAPDV